MLARQNMFQNYQNLTKSFHLRSADLLLYVKNIIICTVLIVAFLSVTRRKVWYGKIDIIINKMIPKSNDVDFKHLAALIKQEDGIKRTISEIEQASNDLKNVLESIDDRLVSAYKFKNIEFKQLPPKLTVSSSSFRSQKINEERLDKQFGYVSLPSIKKEAYGYTLNSRSPQPCVSKITHCTTLCHHRHVH